jgi:phosphatidylserine decarboxylase precursor
MGLLDILNSVADWLLASYKLVENRQVGWKTWNRKTKQMTREQQPLLKKLKLLVLFNPLLEWFDRTHWIRLLIHDKTVKQGFEEGKQSTHKQIKPFIEFYHINMNDFEPSDPEEYSTFEDFFIRRHKAGSRPIYDEHDPTSATAVADSRVVVYDTVSAARKLWVKGAHFSIAELLMDSELAKRFGDGAVASFRLSPQDYHRYHSPVSGTVTEFRTIHGDYYQVDPVALQSNVDILTRNARCWISIETEEFGVVAFVAIGATDVGSVQFHEKFQKKGSTIRKGEEIGLFQFGGSSIVVCFQRDRIRFDQDLLEMSMKQIQTDVEVGMSLGRATKQMS